MIEIGPNLLELLKGIGTLIVVVLFMIGIYKIIRYY